MAKTVKAWLSEDQLGKNKVTIDGETLGYGEENGVEVSEEQLKRARAAVKGSGFSILTDSSTPDDDSAEEEAKAKAEAEAQAKMEAEAAAKAGGSQS